ncbi:hypothetical protein, partial [Pseudomonas aeruginosa]|uniref:hypothetical protein n=1 Tax=Pseudomonas aeruginosa TaxID=287 RepID=UPI001EF743EA
YLSMTKKTSKQKDTKKQTTKKPINYIKIFILLALTIGGGFSGIFFDKFDLKEKFINFRHAVYNYFTSEPIKHYTTKDNENIIARFFSQSDEGKKQQQQSNEFDNLKQYPPVRTLPAVTDYCHGFLAYGNPSYGVTDGLGQANLYLCRDGYVVGYNYQTKEASWVAFNLTKSKV